MSAWPSIRPFTWLLRISASSPRLGRPRGPGALLGIATHDPRLLRRLQDFIARHRVPQADYEFEMLYGIQRRLQKQIVSEGRRLRVLISYGEHWFPWYMRRLAERPANVLFVLRSALSR